MLAAECRLTASADFARTVRKGGRASSRTLVTHRLKGGDPALQSGSLDQPRVGLVVSKAVGGAVVRNRVKRRLRHLLREALPSLSAGELLVVRALPAAGGAPWTELRSDLERCLRGVR